MVEWHLHPDVISLLIVVVGLYLAGVYWLGDKSSPPLRPTRGQVACFAAGTLFLYLGAGSPIHDISETYLFSVHMLQHMLFSLVAPPLLLLGTPGWMLRPLIQGKYVRRVAYAITRPFPAFMIFNAFILVSHLPQFVDLTLRVHEVHFLAHVALVGTAMLMWFPVFSPLPELPRIPEFGRLVYLFVQSLLPAVIASFLAFANGTIYQFYANAPERLWGLSVVEDQQIAGLIMKLAGGAILWGVMAVIFFRWFNEEDKRVNAAGRVQWDDVEAELERMGLTKR